MHSGCSPIVGGRCLKRPPQHQHLNSWQVSNWMHQTRFFCSNMGFFWNAIEGLFNSCMTPGTRGMKRNGRLCLKRATPPPLSLAWQSSNWMHQTGNICVMSWETCWSPAELQNVIFYMEQIFHHICAQIYPLQLWSLELLTSPLSCLARFIVLWDIRNLSIIIWRRSGDSNNVLRFKWLSWCT